MRQFYQSDTSSRSGRPVGVLLIALLCFVAIPVVIVFIAATLPEFLDGSGLNRGQAMLSLVLGVALVPLFSVTGVGLWRLRAWARWLAIGFLAVSIASIVIDALLRYPLSTGAIVALGRGAIPTGLLLYLLHPSIGAAFHRSR